MRFKRLGLVGIALLIFPLENSFGVVRPIITQKVEQMLPGILTKMTGAESKGPLAEFQSPRSSTPRKSSLDMVREETVKALLNAASHLISMHMIHSDFLQKEAGYEKRLLEAHTLPKDRRKEERQ